jgi:hypothetical protein
MRKRGVGTAFNPSTGSNGVGEETRDRALWLAVINQQIEDATTPIVTNDRHEKKRQELQRRQARSWLLSPNADFNEVCALAEVEPDHVRRAAKAKIQAFDAKPPIDNVKRYTHAGKTLTITEWSRLSGIPGATINSRLGLGWSMDEAIGATPRQRKTHPVLHTHNGRSLTLDQWSERTGIARNTIASRLRLLGWSFERAVTTRPDHRRGGDRVTSKVSPA